MRRPSSTQQFETREVLRRGVPFEQHTGERTAPLHQTSDEFEATYNDWLAAGRSYEDIATAYGKLFMLSEKIFGDPELALEFSLQSDLNQPNVMAGLVGGDSELALMELFQGWYSDRKQQRLAHHTNAHTRIRREKRRVGNIVATNTALASQGIFEPDDAPVRRLINGAESIVTAEGIRLTEQIHTLLTIEDMSRTKTSPPSRGIRNATDAIMTLASANLPALRALDEASDEEIAFSLRGSILESETLIVTILAAMKGYLRNAWPIAASQRLDYGFFRQKEDLVNTDLLCVFPTEGITVPVQVHGASETISGEAERVVVVHNKDLYPRGRRSAQTKLGAISLCVLGDTRGNSIEDVEMRAQFVASKINALAARQARCARRVSVVASTALRA